MIIFLSEVQKEHLSLIQNHSTQVLVDFCKLSIDYLNFGRNPSKNNIAAEKLNISLLDVQDLINALVFLIVEGCKHNLSDEDFKSSLAIAGFTSERQEILIKFYRSKKIDISSALCQLQQNSPCYQDLTWRFEVQIASKNCKQIIKPIITMDFVLIYPKKFKHKEEENKDVLSHGSSNLPVPVNSNIHDAKTASHCQNIINHILLQCDIPNLIHLSNKLEQALKESKSQHVRKVQRAL